MCLPKKNKISRQKQNIHNEKVEVKDVFIPCVKKQENCSPHENQLDTSKICEKKNESKKDDLLNNSGSINVELEFDKCKEKKESKKSGPESELKTEIHNLYSLLKRQAVIQYDKYKYLDIFYHKYFINKFPETYGTFCPTFDDFISKNHPLYHKLLPYFEFLLDMTMFFEKNINPLVYAKYVYWRGIETLKKTTLMIIGVKESGKTTFANKLMALTACQNDTQLPLPNPVNFIYYTLKGNKWQCPFESQYVELTKLGSSLSKSFSKYNKTICFKVKNEFLDEFNIIDSATFESKDDKVENANKTPTETENTKNNDTISKYDEKSIESNEVFSLNDINEILFSRVDMITVFMDEKMFTRTLEDFVKKVVPFSKKVLFIFNHSDKAKSRKELEIKKELLRWYIMDKENSNMLMKIHCSSLNGRCSVEEVQNYITSEMKKIHEWLYFYRISTINYRVESICKDFTNSVSQLVMLHVMSRKEKRFINKYEIEYQNYINEAQQLARVNNLPFDKEFIKKSFTYTELPPEESCIITKFDSDWKQLPAIEYFIGDEKSMDDRLKFLKTIF